MGRSNLATWIGVATVLALLGFVAWQQHEIVSNQREILSRSQAESQAPPPKAALPALTLSFEGAAITGSADAKLIVVEFSDFECPFCGRYARDTWPQLERDYVRTGKVRYAFRHAPIEHAHPHAMKAAEAGECARLQGKFWPLHDRLFAHQELLAPAALLDHARGVGVKMKEFEACLDGQAVATVRVDLDAGIRAGITATPAFFFGIPQKDGSIRVVERLQGAKPYTTFQAVLDKLLASPGTH